MKWDDDLGLVLPPIPDQSRFELVQGEGTDHLGWQSVPHWYGVGEKALSICVYACWECVEFMRVGVASSWASWGYILIECEGYMSMYYLVHHSKSSIVSSLLQGRPFKFMQHFRDTAGVMVSSCYIPCRSSLDLFHSRYLILLDRVPDRTGIL